jgi:hypothetical protein
MFLSLETDSNIAPFKMEAIELSLGRKLPHAAAQKLEEILKDDTIQAEEFIAEFQKILASSETLSWKTIVYLTNLKARFMDQIVGISPFQVGFILLLFMGLFFFYKKYISKSKKRTKYVLGLVENLLERFYAFLAYSFPILQLYALYLVRLCSYYPLLNILYPDFMGLAVYFYTRNTILISWTYFLVVCFITLRFKIPRSRFVRFHIVRGLVILNFQSIPDLLLSIFIGRSDSLPYHQQMNVLMFLAVVNLYFILPSLVQAIRHTYPKNAFLREAAEVVLGRDDDPGFKWWDR